MKSPPPIFTAAAGWPDAAEVTPQPFESQPDAAEPFPLHVLPVIAREAVEQYQKYGQQPAALVASSALAAMSLATQSLADVSRGLGLDSAISLNLGHRAIR